MFGQVPPWLMAQLQQGQMPTQMTPGAGMPPVAGHSPMGPPGPMAPMGAPGQAMPPRGGPPAPMPMGQGQGQQGVNPMQIGMLSQMLSSPGPSAENPTVAPGTQAAVDDSGIGQGVDYGSTPKKKKGPFGGMNPMMMGLLPMMMQLGGPEALSPALLFAKMFNKD